MVLAAGLMVPCVARAAIVIQAQGEQSIDVSPGFWSIRNNSSRDLVRIELDLPGDSHRFDSNYGVHLFDFANFDINDANFSFPGDNGDNLRVRFTPGSFMNNASLSFFVDVDEYVYYARDMTGITVVAEFADGTTESDVFRHVDDNPYYDFRPDGAGAALVPEPSTLSAMAGFALLALRRRRRRR